MEELLARIASQMAEVEGSPTHRHRRGRRDIHGERDDAWRRAAGTKALKKTLQAYKDDTLPASGRLTLLQEALTLARQANAPNWASTESERKAVFAQLEKHITVCEAIVNATTLQEIQDAVANNLAQRQFFSDMRTIKNGTKVVERVAKECMWALVQKAMKARETQQGPNADDIPSSDAEE